MTEMAQRMAADIPDEAGAARQKTRPRIRPTAPIVPSAGVSGRSLMIVIAIMSFLASLTLGAVTMVQETAASWQSEISREITIQIKPEEGLDMEEALATAREVALGFSGTTGAEIVDMDATARLLEPWLGEGLDLQELPVPRLVIVTIDETAPPDFAAMRRELEARVPSAFLDDHRAWVERLVSMARTTVLIGLCVLGLVFAATVMTVIFATRGAISGNRHIVEVLHFIGAESRFVANEFQRHFLVTALKGACIGGVLASLAFIFAGFWSSWNLATPEGDQVAALFGSFRLGGGGYAGILAIVVIISILTALTTRITVQRHIAELDLIRSDPSRSPE